MNNETLTHQLSNWAKFSSIVAGYRYFENGKMQNKHHLFNVVSSKFNLSTLSLRNDSHMITEYLNKKYKVENAEGWENGRCLFAVND